jgi:hypothetical protein
VHPAGHHVLGELLGQEARHGVDHGDVDELSPAGVRALVESRRHTERAREADITSAPAKPTRVGPLEGSR